MILYNLLKIETQVISFLLLFIFLLVGIAYLTLLERKLMAAMQRRKGPNLIGFFGLLQPLADGIKLILKETIIPTYSNTVIFLLAPVFTFFCSVILWLVLPITNSSALIDIDIGVLYILAISSLGIYGIIFSGWSSNSKYAFLGGLRSAAQMISYELSIGLIYICIVLVSGSLHLGEIVYEQEFVFFIVPLFPFWVIFIVCMLAETNRAPFDLPEAEAELVSGYNVEYSSITFALFFLGEYANILFMSSICTLFFYGGWLPIIDVFPFSLIPPVFWFIIKTLFNIYIFVWVRASYPRFRYDQLMKLGWKILLPITLAFILLELTIVYMFNLFY